MATSIDALDIQITASANNANVAIDNLVRRLGTLNTSLSRVNGRSFNNLGNSVRNISNGFHNLSSVFSRTNSSIKKTTDLTTSLAQAFGKFYASYFLVIRGTKKLWGAIKSTADYIEAYNYFDVAMGKVGADWEHQWEKYSERAGVSSAEEYADSFADRLNTELRKLSGVNLEIDAQGDGLLTTNSMKNLGLNIQEVTQYASQLASVTNSVGQTGETTLAIADSFTKLAGDISSLFNVSYSTVATNLQSGLIGQSRALYKYGIDITNATLQTKAYELGLEKAVSEMTQMEKMQLRVLAILEQSKVSWGDLANTLQSPSNQIRLLKNNFAELAMVIGQLFMPILSKVLPIINGVVIALKRLAVMIANFFGIKLNLSEYGQGYSDLEEDIGGVSDGFDEATKSVKKFKGQLQKFDELNNLSTGSNSGKGEGIGSTIDLTDEILKATDEYNKAWQKAFDEMENKAEKFADKIMRIFNKIIDYFKRGDFEGLGRWIGDSLTKALDSIPWDKIYESVKDFGKGLAEFMNGLISPGLFGSVGRTIASVLNTAIYGALSFGKNFDFTNLGNSIAEGINQFFSTFDFKALADALNTWAKGLLDAMIEALSKTNWSNVGHQIGTFIEKLDLIAVGTKIVAAIWEAIKAAFKGWMGSFEEAPIETALITAFVAFKFTKLGKFIAGKASTVIATALAAKLGVAGTFSSIPSALIAGLSAALSAAFTSLGGIAGLLTTDLAVIFGAGNAAEIGLTIGTGIIGGIVAAISGFAFGQWLYEWISGETIDLTWGEQFAEIFKSITDGSWLGALKMWGSDIVGGIVAIGQDILNAIFNWDMTLALWEVASSMFADMSNAIEKKDWLRLGGDIIGGIINGFLAAITFILEPITDLFNAIVNGICSIFGIHSPAKSMKPLGEYILLGIVEGFTNKVNDFNTAISNWFDNSVKPWFTIEKWKGIFENIKTSLTNVWNNTVVAWTTGVSNWWTNSVTPWFTVEKWTGILTNVKTAFVNIFNDIKNKITEIISGLWTDISDFFANIGKGVDDAKSNLGEGLGQLPGLGNIAGAVTGKSIPAYATGGFPEDGLFFANRSELVGSFSNGKTAVANNEQITEGIKWAAYEGMKMALSEQQGGNVSVNVSLEGDANRLFKVVKEENYNQFKRTGRNALAF